MARKKRRVPPAEPLTPAPTRTRAKSFAAAAVMLLLVLAVYFPVPSTPQDNSLLGLDYHQLHARRIRFVQEHLATHHSLPGWYPRELMGTPFRANIQNFPFIPTRLALLWLDSLDLFAVSVNVSAMLAALFTFAFVRRLGVTRVGAVVAGWTFACAGFYASRVFAGHLPLLEAYPGLPLLLWRIEVLLRPGMRGENPDVTHGPRHAWRLATLALATLCLVLAGHPQLPLYCVVGGGLYLLYRGRRQWRVVFAQAVPAMVLGAACGAFSLWPMLQLIRRNTRVLNLADADNDVTLPYGRLLAFILPWRDGWPDVLPPRGQALHGLPQPGVLLGNRLLRRTASPRRRDVPARAPRTDRPARCAWLVA